LCYSAREGSEVGDDHAQPYFGYRNRVRVSACVALAQNYQKIQQEYKPQKDDVTLARDAQSGLPTGKRMHKPYTITKQIGSASPALTTQNKPLTPTVNPGLQSNVLQKSGGVDSPVNPGYDLKANKGR
jgi:hypothetical protein